MVLLAIQTSTATLVIAVVLIIGAVAVVLAAILTDTKHAAQAFAFAGVMIGLLGGGGDRHAVQQQGCNRGGERGQDRRTEHGEVGAEA